MTSVYIHLPFCSSICTYCDFSKMYYDKKLIKPYLKALKDEIEKIYQGEEIRTIYIGGGTPNVLDMEDLQALFEILDIFNKNKIEEFTIECNSEYLNKEQLLLFKKNGINRLSIGVQSFNDKLLKVLGRNHNTDMVIKAVEEAKEIGFNNISIDIIYGINNQSMDDLKHDLDMVFTLDIPHVSFYSLIIEPHTKLYIESFEEIDEDLNEEMYRYINKVLTKNNYHHYEISNYAKEGYESKHNLVYWYNEQYYGFGLGASSYIGNIRYDNTRSLNKYLKGLYKKDEHRLESREIMENEMILGLRLIKGVNKEDFYKKYNKRIDEVFPINQLIKDNLLIDDNDYLYIPQDKLFISNYILLQFLG
ncbi:MAG: radical SAM family heme chaperone HemW [Bacilli bacterium]|nr:radical SAM family heme chaperone HemW [Bacilli bacterium]